MGLFKRLREPALSEKARDIMHIRIFANRHGEAGNDGALTDRGRQQVEELGLFYGLEGLGGQTLILSSAEKRCLETARLLGSSVATVVEDPFITELSQRPETVTGLDAHLYDQIVMHADIDPSMVIISSQQPFLYLLRKYNRECGTIFPSDAHILPAAYERYMPGSLPQS